MGPQLKSPGLVAWASMITSWGRFMDTSIARARASFKRRFGAKYGAKYVAKNQ